MILRLAKTALFWVQRLFGLGGWKRLQYTDRKDKRHTVYGRMR